MNSPAIDEAILPGKVETAVDTRYVNDDGTPNVALLQDRMPRHLQASRRVVGLVFVLGVIFLWTSYRPLWHTDLWGHLTYGRWIWQQGRLPVTEPLMPLAKGVPFIDTAWLSQLVGYGMYEQFGPSGIQFLYAAAITLVMSLLSFTVYLRTGSIWASLSALFVCQWLEYHQLLIVRPQLAGMVCFASVFAMVTSSRWRPWYAWTIPAVFLVWANVHGSFIMGLLLLGAVCVGRACDVWLRTRNMKFVLADRATRKLLIALELSAAAVLLNPYGVAIYPEVFAISGNANLASLVEWDPLTLRMKQGQAFAVVSLLLACLYRWTPRRITVRELLLLCGFGVLSLWTSRMIVWWGPVAAYYFGLHLASVLRSWNHGREVPCQRSGLLTVVMIGMIWIFFAYTPFGVTVLHGRSQDPDRIQAELRQKTSRDTPIAIAEYLRNNPPHGQIFNAYEWGDYLLWAGPENLQVFVNSHAHLIPEEVWDHYLGTVRGGSEWEMNLNRYGVNAIVVDQRYRKDFIRKLEEKTDVWDKKFSDNVGAVFYRKVPL